MPRKFVGVMFGTGVLPIPRVTNGRVVCWPPWLNWCELAKSNSKPVWNECAPLVKLSVSANCLNGLIDWRGDATPNGAYAMEEPTVVPEAIRPAVAGNAPCVT